ncbi:hypothetical protein [Peribacillus sp. CSMR9]|nr:hypothetical protein [Peribacillus sp. CSMR9]MDV7767766.1 hypothetical protein [Peribacillus sp. CSMR9]
MKKKIIMWVTGVLVAIILLGLVGMTFYTYAPISEVKTTNESVE